MAHHRTVAVALLAAILSSCRADDQRIRVACVGDSITLGGGENRRDNYPGTLQRLLGNGYDVRNFGVNGATVRRHADQPYVRESAFGGAKEFKPNIAVILLGTNDTKIQNWGQVDRFVADYKSLVADFQALDPKPQIYLCIPVPAYIDGDWINRDRVRELRPRIEQIGKDLHLPVIDLYTDLDGRPELFPDGVHPNPEGAGLIAKAVHAKLVAAELK
jgi:lysophospholipase L1-like esterase